MGILASIVSLAWLIQLIGTTIYVNQKPLLLFLDFWMANLSKGGASFVGTIIFGVMMLYMQVCLVKGNTVFGLRIPFVIKFHPLKLNKTYMNSLLFNSNMMMLSSVATSVMAVWAFPTYLQNTYLSTQMTTAFLNEPVFR